MFPDRLSTVQGWIDLGRCVSADLSRFETIGSDASTTSVDAVSLGELIKVVSEQCRRHFKLNLHPADGLCRVHQIDSDVNGGDTRLLLLAPAGTRFMIQQPAESDQDFASAVRSSVAATHNAETQTNRLDLADLGERISQKLLQVEATEEITKDDVRGAIKSILLDEMVLGAFSGFFSQERAQWEKSKRSAYDVEKGLTEYFMAKSFLVYMDPKTASPKYTVLVVAYLVLLFKAADQLDLLRSNLRTVRHRWGTIVFVSLPSSHSFP